MSEAARCAALWANREEEFLRFGLVSRRPRDPDNKSVVILERIGGEKAQRGLVGNSCMFFGYEPESIVHVNGPAPGYPCSDSNCR